MLASIQRVGNRLRADSRCLTVPVAASATYSDGAASRAHGSTAVANAMWPPPGDTAIDDCAAEPDSGIWIGLPLGALRLAVAGGSPVHAATTPSGTRTRWPSSSETTRRVAGSALVTLVSLPVVRSTDDTAGSPTVHRPVACAVATSSW